MKSEICQNFPEVKGKVVEKVELSVESDYFGISIRFQDRTSLSFVIEPSVFATPVYEDWKSGEGKALKEYTPIRSTVSFETEARLKSS